MKFVDYPDREMMMIDLANILVEDLAEGLQHKDRVTFAVPGGTTPGPVFDALTGVDLDWRRVDVLLTDERWLPEGDARSNTRLIRERLLQGRAAGARLVPMRADTPAPEDSLDALSRGVAEVLPIDVLLLGMGADMHTASLFPGADRLGEALDDDAPPVLPMRAPGAAEVRVTLTLPVLRGALSTHIVIAGADKLAALDKAAEAEFAEDAPVAGVLAGATVHWAE